MDEKRIETLKEWVRDAKRIVFFGGAGVSTESGIPDFRSADGLYNQEYDYPPEQIISHTFYENKPDVFFKFYRNRMLFPDARPNIVHETLARWEKEGRLSAVVTQNIDGLHQMAGSRKVYELHGSVHRSYCESCGKAYNLEELLKLGDIPKCEKCGGRVKPDVVLYEEALDGDVIHGAVSAISRADVLIVAGTSLVVYPAASFIDYYSGNKLVLINKTATPRDNLANLVLHEKLGDVFQRLG